MPQYIATISLIINLLWINPSTDLIKQTREQITHINISFYGKNYPQDISLDELFESFGKLLNEIDEYENYELQDQYKVGFIPAVIL